MELTRDQLSVLEKLKEFFKTKETVFVLKGSAGTGKTTLVQHVIKDLLGVEIIGIAPTHKAKRVLRQRMSEFGVVTLASFLLKQKKHTMIGAKSFSKGSGPEDTFTKGIYIVDEVSMISDADFKALEHIAKKYSNKILAIGDPYQIPAISQAMVERGGILYRRKCIAFSSKYRNAELTEIVRQNKESPILNVARYIRGHICDDFSLKSVFPDFIVQKDETYRMFATWNSRAKIIAYTNEAVEAHNKAVRAALGFKRPFEVGDILMGYENIGYKKLEVENGADYKVVRVDKEANGLRKGVVGWSVRVEDMDEGSAGIFFFPDACAEENKPILSKLQELARKVNSSFSQKRDYVMYRSLKDKLLFLSNLYEYPESSQLFYLENQLKAKEPLLFTPLADLLDEEGTVIKGDLFADLSLVYGDMIEKRLKDDKARGEGETFASAYCIFVKDLDYGYSITAHKSQASTIDVIFVDEGNMDRMRSRVNRAGVMEDKVTEKNQLKYVACTRASKQLYLI